MLIINNRNNKNSNNDNSHKDNNEIAQHNNRY